MGCKLHASGRANPKIEIIQGGNGYDVLLRNVLLYRKRFPDRPPCSMVCRVSISANSVWEHAEKSDADRLGAYSKRELPGVLF